MNLERMSARVISRRSALKIVTAAACALTLGAFATGCAPEAASDPGSSSAAQESAKTLEGRTFNVYCGAGMTDPFQKLADRVAIVLGGRLRAVARADELFSQTFDEDVMRFLGRI